MSMSNSGPVLVVRRYAERLTPREAEVLSLAHLTNQQIADELGISYATVKTLMGRLMLKLGAENRTAAALAWRDRKAA